MDFRRAGLCKQKDHQCSLLQEFLVADEWWFAGKEFSGTTQSLFLDVRL